MAGATSPDNLAYPTVGDLGSPRQQITALADTTQAAFDNRILYTYRWLTTAAMNAQMGMTYGDIGYNMQTNLPMIYQSNNTWVNLVPVNPIYNLARASANGPSQAGIVGSYTEITALQANFTLAAVGTVRLYYGLTMFASVLDMAAVVQIRNGVTILAESTVTPNSSTTLANTSVRHAFHQELHNLPAGSYSLKMHVARAAGTGIVTVVKDNPNYPVQISVDLLA